MKTKVHRPDSFELKTKEGRAAYDALLASFDKLDLNLLDHVEERNDGDREKLVLVLEALSLGARHREATGQVGWTWSEFSIYRSRFGIIKNLYLKATQAGMEMRKIERLDEIHRRAVDGVAEPIYSASGKYCGEKIKYSDTLLAMLVKGDNPEVYGDKIKVESTGVVLNVNMGLRDNVRDTPLEQSAIEVEEVEDKPPEEAY